MKLTKILKNTAIAGGIALLTASPYLIQSYNKISPYLISDIQSELERKPSSGKPTTGVKGNILTGLEHLKTFRDYMLFSYNDLIDSRQEYEIEVDKKTNIARFYLDGVLEKEIPVGTAKVLQDDKTKYGEYVTPNGEYMVINHFDKEDIRDKFGNVTYYGDGLIQLSGPWAPHIAFHGIDDPKRIGAYGSNGCINLDNPDISWMMENVGVGSKVKIK